MSSSVTRSDLAAIILIGGRSSRMGRPKPWLEIAGRPMLARVVERVRPSVRQIVLVAAPGQDLPPLEEETANGPPLTVVRDDHPGAGPLPALACGLRATVAEWALALGCDAPLIRPSIMARLAAERGPDVDVVIPRWDGRLQPLCALYRRAVLPAVGALVAAGERRLHALADLPRVRVVAADVLRALDPEGESFRAVNTPAEHAATVAAWRRQHPSSR